MSKPRKPNNPKFHVCIDGKTGKFIDDVQTVYTRLKGLNLPYFAIEVDENNYRIRVIVFYDDGGQLYYGFPQEFLDALEGVESKTELFYAFSELDVSDLLPPSYVSYESWCP